MEHSRRPGLRARTIVLLAVLALGLAVGLTAPIIRVLQSCRNDGPTAAEAIERYVQRAIGEDLILESFLETCESFSGVSYTAVVDPSVGYLTVVDAFQAVGCESAPSRSRPGVFTCVTRAKPSMTVSVIDEPDSLRIVAGSEF